MRMAHEMCVCFPPFSASNIVEYYASIPVESLFTDSAHNTSSISGDPFRLLQTSILPNGSTDPHLPDTDGDLFTDGYEILYGMDALVPDSVSVDSDGDGLTDFSEQTFKTNPFQFDSDGDGVNDGTELQDGTPFFFLNSSITSRRHTIRKLNADHPSPSPSSSQSAFLSGAPNVSPSSSKSASPNASSSQSPSPYPTSAPLAKPTAPPRKACDHLTCKACRADPNPSCYWSIDTKKCVEVQFGVPVGRPFPPRFRPKPEDCPCEKCKRWAAIERNDTAWPASIPRCPCKVKYRTEYVDRLWPFSDVFVTYIIPLSSIWSTDPSCNPNTNCCTYHPGAYGCIRAPSPTTDAGQQCCYDVSGNIILSGTGAGTPDKEQGTASNVYDHHVADVWPFKDCCVYCEISSCCDQYIGGLGTVGVRQETRNCTSSP
jgi:hypothetical protein